MLFRSPDELGFDPNQVTPGWIGFTATALVAVVIMLLLWDFNRRVRRINNRAEAKERIAAELAERDAAAARASGGDAASDAVADARGDDGGG
ncbi:hypothetical protein, partial [Agrococcus sp. HG114]|uniref:hypothetical protein n=1 Tax=Agrococcus sp. HG114 TaxID=2969757 RepID=UPI00215AC26A